MKIPQYVLDEVMTYVYSNKSGENQLYYIDMVAENDKPTMYIWASRWYGKKKNGKAITRLAYKETIHRKLISRNTSVNMFGWTYLAYDYTKGNYKLQPYEKKGTPNFVKNWYHHFIEYNDEKLVNVLKQCSNFKYMNETCYDYVCSLHHTELFDYLNKWVDCPNLEMLTKFGLGYMYKDQRHLKTHRDQKQYIKYISNNLDIIKEKEPKYNFLRGSFNRNINMRKSYLIETLKNTEFDYKTHKWVVSLNYNDEQIDYLYSQLNKGLEYYNIKTTYNDYLEMAKTLNIKDLMPSNLKETHDKLQDKITEIENIKLFDKINKISTIVEKVIKDKNKINDLCIKMVHTYKDFTDISSVLHNCVSRVEHYRTDMAEHLNYIFGIWKNDRPIACVEIGINKNKYNILQCYGEHNTTHFNEYEDCIKLCNLFISQRKQIELALN